MLRARVPDSIVALANTPLKKDLQVDEFGKPISGYVNTKLTRNYNQTKSNISLSRGIKHPQIVNSLRLDSKSDISAKNSYLAMEKKKHIVEGNTKVNWQSLEKMKVNDLKGFQTENFELTELIGYEDPEDKEYLRAFNLDPEKKQLEDRKVRRQQEMMSYGIVKRSLPRLESKRSFTRMDPYRTPAADPLPLISRNRFSDRNVNISRNHAHN